jgi:hypothetical protein
MSAEFLLEVFPELIAHSLTEQQRRDRQILEADNDSINWLIDQMRGQKASRTPPLTPETELETDAALSQKMRQSPMRRDSRDRRLESVSSISGCRGLSLNTSLIHQRQSF